LGKTLNCSFGAGRDAFAKVVSEANKYQADAVVPGPGQYQNVRTIARDAKKYSMSPRTKY